MASHKPFQPLGAEARWRPVYRHLSTLSIGDVLDYSLLCELAGTGTDLSVARGEVYRAIQELEDQHHRTAANVRGVGYRVVDAPEHEWIAESHRRRSGRQLGKARRKYRSADRARLTPELRERFEQHELRLGQVEAMIRRLHKRQALVEEKADTTAAAQGLLAADMAKVKEILGRHGLLGEAQAA